MDITNMTLVAFDIEANGFGPQAGGRIIEIGACKIFNGKIMGTFSKLANPGKKIRPLVTEITGITNAMLRTAPQLESVMASFEKFIGDAVLVAHDADQDIEFLKIAFKKQGIAFNNEYICTKRAFNKLKKITAADYECTDCLSSIASAFGIDQDQAHRAGDDALVTARILLKINGLCPDAVEIVDVNSPANMKYKQLFDSGMPLAEIADIRECKLTTVEKQFLNWLSLANMHKYDAFIKANLIELSAADLLVDAEESTVTEKSKKQTVAEKSMDSQDSMDSNEPNEPNEAQEQKDLERRIRRDHSFQGKLSRKIHHLTHSIPIK